MDYNSAKKLVLNEFPELVVQSSYEYSSFFVFNLHGKGEKDAIGATSISCNKNTGEIKAFKPFDLSVKEYDSGKIVEGVVKKSDVRLVR